MPNYQDGKIYKLVSNISSDIYIGSTINKLSHRLNVHKCKNNKCVSKQLFANDAVVQIILIEMFPCSSKIELVAREHHYITTLVCINKNIPFVTDIVVVNGDQKEWQKAYKELHVEQIKQYYINNKEHIVEQKNQPYICECGSTITRTDKSRHMKTKKHTNRLESIKIE